MDFRKSPEGLMLSVVLPKTPERHAGHAMVEEETMEISMNLERATNTSIPLVSGMIIED